jgi:hypothetical protein
MQNFGQIKNAFNELMIDSLGQSPKSKNKNLFQKYIKTIKESEILKTQFLIYNNIEQKIDQDPNSINFYIQENIKLLSKYKPSDIIKENTKLVKLSENLNLTKDYNLKMLHESLSTVIFTKPSPNTVDKISKEIKSINDYILNNKKREVTEGIDLPLSMVSTLMVDKYNEHYNELDENTKNIIKSIIDSNDEEKKVIYTKVINECIELINTQLIESDTDSKEKLLMVKDKLLNDKESFNNESFTTDISKLIELKEGLIA